MPLPSWIRRFFSTNHRSISKTRTGYRPRVEALEHRINPGGSGGGTGTHAPVTIDEIVETMEDTPYTFQLGDFHFSDPNDNPPDNFAAVKVVSLPANGVLKLNNEDVAVDQEISVEDIEANLFTFLPADDENGEAYATWNFAVQDNSSVADTSATHSMTVDVTAVNDAPNLAEGDLPATYGTSEVTIDEWVTPGGGADEASQTLNVSITNISNPNFFAVQPAVSSNGTLTYTLAQILDGTATFDIQVQDNGGTANGGCDSSGPTTFTVTVQNQGAIPVNTTEDHQNVIVLNGQPSISLRAAVRLINAGTATATINIGVAPGSTITLGSELPGLNADFTINGPSPRSVTVQRSMAQGTPPFSIFHIGGLWEVTISNLIISNGLAQFGGGVSNDGIVSLLGVALSGNNATGAGGAIHNGTGATAVLWECLVANNSATSQGGGIANSGTVWVQFGTEISNNNAQLGGGIVNYENAVLTVDTGSIIRINGATLRGGGIYNVGTMTMSDAFLLGNWATEQGGGLFNGLGAGQNDATLTNVEISGNRATSVTVGHGGGIYVFKGTVELAGGCTLEDNFAAVEGGGNGACLYEGALLLSGINQIVDDIVNE